MFIAFGVNFVAVTADLAAPLTHFELMNAVVMGQRYYFDSDFVLVECV